MCICQVPEEPLPKEADTKAQWQFCFVAIQFVDIPLQVSLCPSELRKRRPKLLQTQWLTPLGSEICRETYRDACIPVVAAAFVAQGFLGVFVEVLFLPQRDGLPLVQLAALDSRTCPIGAWWESIAKDCEGGWARLQPDGSCKCEQCSSFIFASLGVFDYFWFLVHAYVAKIWDTTWYKHGQLHTSLAISPSHALIFTHFATCWKVHGMSATGQRNPLQFEYLTDFWCALAAQLDLIEGFEPWDFWNI